MIFRATSSSLERHCWFSLSKSALPSGLVPSYALVMACATALRTAAENQTCGLPPSLTPPISAALMTCDLADCVALTAHESYPAPLTMTIRAFCSLAMSDVVGS